MLADHHHFKLFAHCIPVKGANRSVICDLQRRTIDYIPNSLYDLLAENKSNTIGAIKQKYGRESAPVIQDYFSFLIEKEYLFLCDEEELDLFPDLELTWEIPNQIDNAIIDADENSHHNYSTIFQQLSDLGCVALQIRNYYSESFQQIKKRLDLLKQSRIETVEIITGYSQEFTSRQIQELAEKYPRLSSFVLHSAPSVDCIAFQHDYLSFSCSPKQIDAHTHCGLVAPHFFSITLDSFLESQAYNSCLNQKISVAVDGQIKNCPSLPNGYGHIDTTTLEEALSQDGFKQLWKINKDQISVCKDCEFRHICTDCRAYLENPEDLYSKPLKCGYDPYTNQWQKWSTHPMKEKAIEYYGLKSIPTKNPIH